MTATILPFPTPATVPFTGFGKMARLNRPCIVTEKLDGTNAQVIIDDNGDLLRVGSRTRWITPGKQTDNYGFAAYVHENRAAFEALGPGAHFGEWWGQGIQRGYDLDERRFSLFNTARWNEDTVPAGLFVVPELWVGVFDTDVINNVVGSVLRYKGSAAAPGYMNPEGFVVFHTALNNMFKVTLENDQTPKSLVQMESELDKRLAA